MSGSDKSDRVELPRCPFCGTRAKIIWVHGHGQCSACGINREECCQGEQCEAPERLTPKVNKAQ